MADGKAYGMTPQGFVPKRLAEIVDDLNANMALIVDARTGERAFQNATDDSLLQQFLGVVAEGLAECWTAAFEASAQFDPRKNSGAGQAGCVQLNAILKKPGEGAVWEMLLAGFPGTVIPAGARMGTADGLVFESLAGAVIPDRDGTGGTGGALEAPGTARVNARCTVKGPRAVPEGGVIHILTPYPGWTGARFAALVSPGTDEETEEELRVRQQRSTSLTGRRHIDSIYAGVANVPGVTWCRACQNDRYYPFDARGIPFKEVAVVVEGGDEAAIADALFLRFPVTVAGYGNTSVVRHDEQGASYAISFSRPVPLDVAVFVELEITTRANFPDSFAQKVREEIIAYARYGGEGNQEGFPPGADISRSRLYTPVNRVPGHRVKSLRLSLAGSEGADADIPVPWNKVARFLPENIHVSASAKEDVS